MIEKKGEERDLIVASMLGDDKVRKIVDTAYTVSRVFANSGKRAGVLYVTAQACKALQVANNIVHGQGPGTIDTLKSSVMMTLVFAERTIVTALELGALERGLVELARAEELYPVWPENQIEAVAIMVEEAGEALEADLSVGRNVNDVCEELVQVIAMCIRILKNLED
ncbi:hypothetical protein JWJ90_13305 [Desulfobulbus rhabdoformis]|uniref:hypothetical protein n=1 Tax=Desulfobulbus rhabdoformis TaxID=34032 RepID=UPI0019623B64|nr:hypothetical protein [Desulfobulbus rhabdoformis]MBM9615257.1 hypothetical protein [Desulfobulbus rhabdoformis]